MNDLTPKVEQRHALAAADLIEAYWPHDEQMQRLAKSYRCGHVQGIWALAFARFDADTQSELTAAKARIAELEAALHRDPDPSGLAEELERLEPRSWGHGLDHYNISFDLRDRILAALRTPIAVEK